MGRSSSIRAELLRHLNTDPDHWTPYRHTYYRETQLAEAEYRVRIDFRIAPGSLSYGELYVPGAEPGEILVSTHVCHPLLGNDNLSGVVIGALLAQDFQQAPRRFLFVPATLRPIVWLSRNETVATAVRADLVLAGVGDDGAPTYMRSRRGAALINRAIAHVFRHYSPAAKIPAFAPTGYEQRQCDSWRPTQVMLDIVQENRRFENLSPKGEPHPERLGLLWLLNLFDGPHTLLDIAERSGLPFWHGGCQLEQSGPWRRMSERDAQ